MSGAAGGHSNRTLWIAFAANLGIAVAKFVGFVFTGSGSMLAEGVHSLADTGNQALLLFGPAPGSLRAGTETLTRRLTRAAFADRARSHGVALTPQRVMTSSAAFGLNRA